MVRTTGIAGHLGFGVVLGALACMSAGGLQRAETAEFPEQTLARGILDATGIQGGLVVHLGCGDGKLTAALRANDRYLVHGLDTDAGNVQNARRYVESLGLYGGVSIEQFDGRRLPYVDNLVNLVVAEDLGEVPGDEVMRVLCPLGAAYVKSEGKWTTRRKPRPAELDEWTHFLHDASNNAVAADTRVGPPRRMKWVCEPLWCRSHEFKSSVCTMISAGGRLFYVLDEGLTSITDAPIPERWTLIARDAFNGLLLWKHPLPNWGASRWKGGALRGAPVTLQRLLVADGDRVFITFGYDAPISVLHAATGEVLTTFEETEGTDEIRCHQGALIARKGKGQLRVMDTKTGKLLWNAEGKIQPVALAAEGGKVIYQDGPAVICRRLVDGQELWRAEGKSPLALIVAHGDCVLLASRRELQAVSAGSGETLWTVNGGMPRGELFVASDRLWHWEGKGFAGRDLDTGKVTARVDPSEVFTPGHHPRCYQSKATEKFLITPYRGVEFISLTGGEHTQCDWTRGACRYGIMPCNGLLYAPPHPCFCYPGVKLTGLNALAPKVPETQAAHDKGDQTPRLERGPAYSQIPNPKSQILNPDGWPTYRHDARRSGATVGEVAPQVSERWRVDLGGRLTPPVVCGARVYVAAKDAHTLHALSKEDGRRLWQFTAGGRIDSPPTVYGELVLFGCADGRVYCLRADDGELVWRFRAAPSDRRIMAFGQLESPWRVHGSILMEDGVAYGTAGRSSYLDGGIGVFGLDPATGRLLHETRLDTWARTREDAQGKPFVPGYHMEGARSDVLVAQGGFIYLGQAKFDRQLVRQEVPYILADPDDKTEAMDLAGQPFVVPDKDPKADYETHQRKWLENTQKGLLEDLHRVHGSHSLGDRNTGLHVFSTAGFLDDSWFNRIFWMYSATWPGYYLAHRGAKTGQLLVVGPEKTYAVQGYPSRNLQSPLFTPGEKGYLLFADDNGNEPVLDYRTRGTTKGWGFTRLEPPVWHQWVPVRIRAMVLAGEHLFVAGPPDVVDPDDLMAAFEGRKGAVLRVHSAADGKMLAEHKLDAPPVFDGLIAASGRLFTCTTDGQVVCFGEQ